MNNSFGLNPLALNNSEYHIQNEQSNKLSILSSFQFFIFYTYLLSSHIVISMLNYFASLSYNFYWSYSLVVPLYY